MRDSWLLASLLLMTCASGTVTGMEPMEDASLAAVSAQEGVQLTLRLRNNVDSGMSPINCSGQLNPCRMGIEFSGREGIWLMLKDYYGFLEINDIRLESIEMPSTPTSHADPDRFLALDGVTCLVPGCDPGGLPAVRVSYPYSKGIGQYNDLNLFMNIGRVALEFDSADGLTPGYMRDVASGSVLGFRMADSASLNAPSRSRFDGTAYVYGF
ncbi:MAG: hypothetical protein LPK06_03135 [Marinobacter sp.]|nr:hypothetical protein [Marinobacter sp.]